MECTESSQSFRDFNRNVKNLNFILQYKLENSNWPFCVEVLVFLTDWKEKAGF